MKFEDIWFNSFTESQVLDLEFISQPKILENLNILSNKLIATLSNKNTIFTAGNGGSYCEALHFSEELIGKYRQDRSPLASIALGEASNMSCIANDYGFECIFSRQLEALGKKGDTLIVYSTSGNSKNIIKAVEVANYNNIFTIGILGRNGGILKDICNHHILIPGETSDRIQEISLKITHICIETIERSLFPHLY